MPFDASASRGRDPPAKHDQAALRGARGRGTLLSVVARLSPLETQALDAFARGLRARFGGRLRELVLFGSRARGEGRDDSDLDLLVVIQGMSRGDRRAAQDLAADVGLEHHLVLSPFVADLDAFLPDLPLARAIRRDGVPL
jgi:predicted nucleotidyltransferase